ncbi:conjugal transfer protein TrbJ [Pseudomonas protegens]|uniref:conjugal transfer protein TrbJ n=1 Tax=Pseudomonas protegens TaxID=380021 RepID=UPI003857A865
MKEDAFKASLTVAEYLRRLSPDHEIKSTLDFQYVAQIVKINADHGRRGLLKLWLTDDAKLRACGTPLTPGMVRALLKRIEANQYEILQLVQALKF